MKREPIPASVELDVDALRRRDPQPVLILHLPVKLDRFLEEREPGWTGLEALLREAGAKPERLGPSGCAASGASTAPRRRTSRSRAAPTRRTR